MVVVALAVHILLTAWAPPRDRALAGEEASPAVTSAASPTTGSATVGAAGPPELPPPPGAEERIPFPLERRGDASASSLPPPPRNDVVVELRDPFEIRARSARSGDHAARRLLLPDLKDPFTMKQGLRPKNWVQLPGDIRNPFAPGLEKQRKRSQLGGCLPPEQVTQEGIVVQQPRKKKKSTKSREHCPPTVPLDLRDPFRN